MNIEYIGRNYTLHEGLRETTEAKLRKLARFLEEPIDIRLTLEQEKHRRIADLHITHRLGVLQAGEETDDMLDSLNAALDKAERQARRSRKRMTDKRRRSSRGVPQPPWPMEVLEAKSIGAKEGPRIVKSSLLQIKPMSLEEAALQLEEGKNDFVVFLDASTEQVSVLYRRRDNNYGLIAPEL